MHTLSTIILALLPGAWALSLDLTDAYLHIPIHLADRKFLCFIYWNKTSEFAALPFGFSTSPRAFIRVTKVIVAHLLCHNVSMYYYRDDWLIVSRSRTEVQSGTQLIIDTTQRLSFLINFDKSHLVPSQCPTYLRATLDLNNQVASLTPSRLPTLWTVSSCSFPVIQPHSEYSPSSPLRLALHETTSISSPLLSPETKSGEP